MGRKLPFLPTCGSPSKTLSFRAVTTASNITGDLDDKGMTQETESSIESVIQGLSSDRFFFNPGKTSSILEEAKAKEKEKEKEKEKDVTPFKENVSLMEIESTDPYVDFKKSMQEMVEADEGLKQWDNLQELLSMYLSLNDKINHGYIIRAFVDILLVNLGPSSSTSTSSSCSSSINGQEQSILLNGGTSNSNSNHNKTMNISTSHESPESIVSFTSSSASTSETCSSTSHCLSSYSLEDDDVNHEDDEDLSSPQKVAVSDDVS